MHVLKVVDGDLGVALGPGCRDYLEGRFPATTGLPERKKPQGRERPRIARESKIQKRIRGL